MPLSQVTALPTMGSAIQTLPPTEGSTLQQLNAQRSSENQPCASRNRTMNLYKLHRTNSMDL
ncbi:UNVERIFIED_CONTAM: hypothetical protein HDU68_007575 [Siphonaria sp. JEL0065]|nr:hypothetical protein HDU68_007575 [Siphonaria sp. JEL0065]